MFKTIVIASSNPGKVKQLLSIIGEDNKSISILSLNDFPSITPPIEDGESFSENAIIKAKYYSEKTGIPVIADDSGLEIEELNWEPSIHTAGFAEENGGYEGAFAKIESLLAAKGLKSSRARFICVLTLYADANHHHEFRGEIDGTIRLPAKGENGFAFDPIFVPDNYDISFAQMSKEEKNLISHRGIASKKLLEFLHEQK